MVKRPRVLERTSSKSSFLHPKHVKTCSMPLADISACWALVPYCPSLLQLQPSLIKLIPSTRNSVPENNKQKCSLLLIACISDVSAAHNYGSLLVTLHLFLKKYGQTLQLSIHPEKSPSLAVSKQKLQPFLLSSPAPLP